MVCLCKVVVSLRKVMFHDSNMNSCQGKVVVYDSNLMFSLRKVTVSLLKLIVCSGKYALLLDCINQH
jgi:hypothetical protein